MTVKEANLEKADYISANLKGADFKGANLEKANFQGADLQEANLNGINFNGANLQKVNFRKANLQGAKLKEANLEGAQYLSIDQLSNVKTLYNAKLDEKLLVKLKEKYPSLLEKTDKWLSNIDFCSHRVHKKTKN